LKAGDVLKISLGAHIDGFGGILADTIVVPEKEGAEEEITGRKADVLIAAWLASEVATRLVKPGNKNFDVTDAVAKVAQAFGCKPLEGTLCHRVIRSNGKGCYRINSLVMKSWERKR
jgi:methionine aminopeptidase